MSQQSAMRPYVFDACSTQTLCQDCLKFNIANNSQQYTQARANHNCTCYYATNCYGKFRSHMNQYRGNVNHRPKCQGHVHL